MKLSWGTVYALECVKCEKIGVVISDDRYATRTCIHCWHKWSRYAERQWALSDEWQKQWDERHKEEGKVL